MQSKVRFINSNQSWNSKKRYKINETVTYQGIIYQNSTGINTDPTLGVNWDIVENINQIDLSVYNVYANDSAAASGGIRVGFGYINSSTGALTKRLT